MIFVTDSHTSKAIDNRLINEKNIPGIILMEQAAMGVVNQIMQKESKRILVVCGSGNNGGDGFAVARILKMRNCNVKIAFIGKADKIKGDALINYNAATGSNLSITVINDIYSFIYLLNWSDTVIDGIFGTGLDRNITGLHAEIINKINQSNAYKIAIDIPSGVNADNGKILGICVKADETVTFQTIKRGLLLFPGRDVCGKLTVSPIASYDWQGNEFILEKKNIDNMLPKRFLNSHKGTYGKLLMIAGSDKYPGAAIISAKAAIKSGVGMIKLITCKRTADCILSANPEIMTVVNDTWNSIDFNMLKQNIDWCDGISIGMGLGEGDAVCGIIEMVLDSGKKTLLDADALNTISKYEYLKNKLHSNCIITPHIGEFSKLTGIPISQIEESPLKITEDFLNKYDVNVLLKGATSIIMSTNNKICYNITGNSGLAKGGSGDMLSGIISSYFVQGMTVFDSACAGSFCTGYICQNCNISENELTASLIIDNYSVICKNIN